MTTWKDTVRLATTGNISSLVSPPSTLDGITLAANDRVLVKDQTTASQNGIYVLSSGALVRAADSLESEDVVRVSEGAANSHTAWCLTTQGSITPGTTALTFKNVTPAALDDVGRSGDVTDPIDRVRGFRGVALVGNDGDAPPIGGTWTYDERPDATIGFKPDNPVPNGWFDPRHYGAKFDGETDDLPAFQAMLMAMPSTGGHIHLPEGLAWLSDDLVITKRVHMVGHGGTDQQTNGLFFAPGKKLQLDSAGVSSGGVSSVFHVLSETIERRPAAYVVARVIRPKYIPKDRERGVGAVTNVLIAPTLQLPIPRGLAGPGMLADTIVKRWQHHLPLNRLEGIYGRDGIEIARSTMCGWHSALADLCEPLIAAMRADAFKQPYLCTDATGVLVQQKERCRLGHFWVLVAPGRHVLFEFTRDHTSDAVDDVLAGYQGYLVADAHAVYDHLYASGDLVEVNCWAHARRYYFKALGSDPERAKMALGLISALFKIERTLADSPRKKKEQIRQKRSRPIVDAFFSWCDAEAEKVLDDTPISAGIRYSRNQREGLSRFIEDGRLPIHNNMSELALRREAVGRKNWLFVGSDDGGAVNATFTSLLASCQLCDVEPWAYLRDLFCLIPSWPEHALIELAPLNWKTTRERTDVIERLDANRFRRLTLRDD
jgi:transposase